MLEIWPNAHKATSPIFMFFIFALGWLSISLWGDAVILWLNRFGISKDNAVNATALAVIVTVIFFGAMYAVGFTLRSAVEDFDI